MNGRPPIGLTRNFSSLWLAFKGGIAKFQTNYSLALRVNIPPDRKSAAFPFFASRLGGSHSQSASKTRAVCPEASSLFPITSDVTVNRVFIDLLIKTSRQSPFQLFASK
jgi:hypothetical protein